MPTQSYRIVNLTKKEVLDPKLLGMPRALTSFAFTGSPVMGGLLWLLSGRWETDEIAIVGSRAQNSDLPTAEDICGIPASQLCFPANHGHERFKPVSKKVREALASDYGYQFALRSSSISSISETGTEETSESSITFQAPDAERAEIVISEHSSSVVLLNLDKNQFITPEVFGHQSGLGSIIANPWSAEGANGWLPTALAVLLSVPVREGDEMFVPDFSGSWAGDRISVVTTESALPTSHPQAGLHSTPRLEGWDVSVDLYNAMDVTGYIEDRLVPRSNPRQAPATIHIDPDRLNRLVRSRFATS